jgi:uncharacterized protein YbaR (Trm112 family)
VFIPLVDILRCPNPHDDTWLVASIDRADERDIVIGTLGCPSCLAEYPIRAGVVHFADVPPAAPIAVREDDAVRVAAALDLTEARRTAVLHGAWGALAPIVRGVSPAQLLLVNAPAEIVSGDGVSIVRAALAPLAHASVDAVALDGAATDAMIASLVASLRAGGRMLGPVAQRVPDGLTELTRDDEIWVATLDATRATSAPVPLGRRPIAPRRS